MEVDLLHSGFWLYGAVVMVTMLKLFEVNVLVLVLVMLTLCRVW